MRISQSSQFPQTAYMPLTSALVLGLGRTNNYVENLFVGISRHEEKHVASYANIIPNSQLIIIPYEEANQGPDDWQLEMYMNPSTTTFAIIAVLVGVILALAAVILALDVHERRQDEEERKVRLHEINFDVL
jgi:integrin alpha FG-GAP repeat containing protein 1